MSTPESIGESPCNARRFTPSSRAREVVAARALEEGGANRSPRADILLLSLLVAVPVILTLCAGYAATARSHPTDDELTVRFFSHESDFQSLVQILESDRGKLLSLGAESYEFTDFVPTGAGTAHLADYKDLLARIGSTNFRYFPRSANLILPASRSPDNFAETEKSYLYLSRGEPQQLRRHQSDSWRGPGVYFVAGDQRIKGRWFIHHDGTLVVAFSPY
jgi:hypothetical protein